MNHDTAVSTTLYYHVLTLVCCLPVHGRSGWHVVAQHITEPWSSDLRSGTRLPNTPIWHLVAQLYGPAHGCPTLWHGTWLAHGCPTYVPLNSVVHFIRSRWTSFIYAVIISDIYYSSDPVLHVMNYGHIILRLHAQAELCVYFINVPPPHSMLLLWRHSSMSIVTIWLWVYWHTRCSGFLHAPFHGYIISTLFVSTIFTVMTFSILCSRSSHLFLVLSVSIHRYVEPFVISWLSGFSSHDMISVMMTLCILVILELLCTVIIRCASRGTLLW